MRLGVYLNLYGEAGAPARPEDLAEQARLAEQAGFAWVVLGERHLHPPGYHEVITTLAWLAARTERIGLATAGLIAPLYQPVLLAEQLSHLHVLSGGRLTAGFVLGYRPEEFAMVGVPEREKVRRTEKLLALLPRLWGGETVDGVSLSPLLPSRPGLWYGGRAPAALARAARYADGWTTSFNETDEELAAKIPDYRLLPAIGGFGREVIVCREGFCAPTSQQARATLEPPLGALYHAYTDWKRTSADAVRYTQGWDTIAARSVIGSPAGCLDRIERYRRLGADGLVLRVQPPGLSHADTLRCLERFGADVLPHC